ncbi:MAG: Ldh family oxidoreductase, partial [bacterium]
MLDYLRTVKPTDPARPVMVPGDPEYHEREQRLRDGVPVPEMLDELVRKVCTKSGAAYVLGHG